MREIAVWHEVKHPNILPLHGLYWGANAFPSMVSPWCENGSINQYLATRVDEPNIDDLKLTLVRHA